MLCVKLFINNQTITIDLHINDQTTHQRKKLKLPYIHCYTKNITKIWTGST